MLHTSSTICAIATAPGGAIGIVRISGPSAIALTETLFRPRQGAPLRERKSHSLTFGTLVAPDGSLIDEVLVSLFRPPHSYTGEESVEISCHGSQYILQTVLRLLIDAGAVPAAPGEFTQRAFLNGRMDLSQAEAVADVIASTTAANHRIAMSQMRGDFSRELEHLRERLLHLTALLELELDFSDHEDLEFADRTELARLAEELEQMVARLVQSFATGNALKNGLPVAIVGSTNSGKSTLLNALLHDERAIVSDIHGTTRDVIEDTYNLGGTLFRFIDTAGLRTTTDTVEQMGIERSWQKLSEAQIVLFVVDSTQAETQLAALAPQILHDARGKTLIVLFNKSDLAAVDIDALTQKYLQEAEAALPAFAPSAVASATSSFSPSDEIGIASDVAAAPDLHTLAGSAHAPADIDRLTTLLVEVAAARTADAGAVVVTNARHYAALTEALADLRRVRHGLATHLSGDFVAQDLRECLFHLAQITGGAITTDEVLGTIFRHFCVGK